MALGARSESADAMLGPLFDAFEELNVATQRVVYGDDAVRSLSLERHNKAS